MSRRRRRQTPNLIRHVMGRGNGRMGIYLDDRDYREFVHLLGEVVDQFVIHCWNYCLMPNHYHLTLQPTLPNLSEAVRHLNSRYAQWWNRRHSRVGHVFQGRFKDQIVDQEGYLLNLSRYIVVNPVRGGLVAHPEDWRWSSYRATVGIDDSASFLSSSKTLRMFGERPDSELQAEFAQFVSSTTDDSAAIDRFRSNERVIGSAAFKQSIEDQ